MGPTSPSMRVSPIKQSKRHNKSRKQAPLPGTLKWPRPLTFAAASLVLLVFSAPLIRTCVVQVQLILPWTASATAYRDYTNSLARSPEIVSLWRAFHRLSTPTTRPSEREVLARLNSTNGLRSWLDLLIVLRENDAAPASQPAWASQPTPASTSVLAALDRTHAAPPVRLHVIEEQELADKALQDLSPRERAAQAEQMPNWYSPDEVPNVQRSCRPVLRELADRLRAQADQWRKHGHQAQARDADEAIIRLMSEVVADSPTPELAMLAAEEMVPALKALGAQEQAARLETFQQQWRKATQDDRINLLPCTREAVLAPRAHDRVMRSLAACLVMMAACAVLVLLSLLWLLVMTVAQPPDEVALLWQGNGRGAYWAPIITCSPVLIALPILAFADIPWTWLGSYPSMPAAILSPAILLVSSGAATWRCVRPTDPFGPCRMPSKAIWMIAALLLPTLAAMLLFLPIHHQAWAPPVLMQRFRQWGLLLGALSVVLAVVWCAVGAVHRSRTGLPPGVWARANLSVTAPSLLLSTVLLTAVLGINQYCDLKHQQTFVQAAADPIADRLGADWKAAFTPTALDVSSSQPPATSSQPS
jgi:hypothetical protein